MILPKSMLNLPSPLERLHWKIADERNIGFWVKRDDLIHPWLSGNKWRKLKYNLDFALQNEFKGIISFGGAYSNHIYAVAGACHLYGLRCTGIIRGDEAYSDSPTLQFCREMGMQLHFVDRTSYRYKESSPVIKALLNLYRDYYLVPEGGTNSLAIQGAEEIMSEYFEQTDLVPDFIALSAGTGGTAAGVLKTMPARSELIVVSALKTDYLRNEILEKAGLGLEVRLQYLPEVTFGGYAKYNQELLDFMKRFEDETLVPVDHVYNAKVLYRISSMIETGEIPAGSNVLWIHTGGIQGKSGIKSQNNNVFGDAS